MKTGWALYKRELTSLFLSPVAYVFAVLTLFGLGSCFVLCLNNAVRLSSEFSLPGLIESFHTFLFWLVPIPLCTAITMRLFSEEKRSGTIETLMTAPVTDLEVVLAKYLGALTFYALLVAPTSIFFLLLGPASADPGLQGAVLLGLLLLGSLFLSVGCLASALSAHQIVAAIVTAAALTLLAFGPPLLKFSSVSNEAVRGTAAYLNLMPGWTGSLVGSFDRGFVTLGHLAYPLSGTACCLFLAVKVMESRSWK